MRRSVAVVAATAAAVLAAMPLSAQGSSVDQHSACMSGRVGTGVASPCDDGSAVFFSPAALSLLPGAVGVGVTLIRSGNVFRYDPALAPAEATVRRGPEWANVPSGFATYRPNERLAAGIGVFAPYGLGIQWPVCPVDDQFCGEPNFEGRYTGYDNELRGIYVQPTVAYNVIPERLAVGVGVDVVFAGIGVRRRVAGPDALGLRDTDIADADLSGSGHAVTGHVGANFRIADRSWVGARYLHSARADLTGDAVFRQVPTGNPVVDAAIGAQFAPGAPLADQGVSTSVEFPAHVVVGLSHQPIEGLTLLADWQRTFWSSFDELVIEFDGSADTEILPLGYRDANTFRFALDYLATPRLAVRAGFRYNEAATPGATPLLPENERNYYTAGIGYRVTPQVRADLSYQYVVQPSRAGSVRPGGGRAGVYESSGQTFGITLSYRFAGPGFGAEGAR